MLAAAAKKVTMAATNATTKIAANKVHLAKTSISNIATATAATASISAAGIHTKELFTLDKSIFNQVFNAQQCFYSSLTYFIKVIFLLL